MKKILIIILTVFSLFSCKQESSSNPFESKLENYNYDKTKIDQYLQIYNETNNLIYALNLINYPLFLKPNTTSNDYLIKENILLVNTNYKLQNNFIPKNLTEVKNVDYIKRTNQIMQINSIALDEYLKLYNKALEYGLNLTIFSAYRSYQYQENLYNNSSNGFVAAPGTSEHQTGLALDIATRTTGLTSYFDNTLEATFLFNNAYQYGFILRYPMGKEHITGYPYESWHYRYVGKDAAKIIYENNLTLEEYFYYYIVL